MKKLVITEKLNEKIKEKNLSQRKLAKIIDYDDAGFNNMILGKQAMPKPLVNKILPILEVSMEEFESWLLADKYSKEILELAIKNKKEFPYKRKSMLTTKLDAILKEKGFSRTGLSKKIVYSQSGLNRMIVGKINMSKPVIEKVSRALEISQEEIFSWILVDKYSLELLEMAWGCKG